MQVTVYQGGNLSHNSHMINLGRFLAGGSGRVDWVFGDLNDETAAGPHEDDDRGGISYLVFENGVRGLVRQDKWGYCEAEVVGTGGIIRVHNDTQEMELWTTGEGAGSLAPPLPAPPEDRERHRPGGPRPHSLHRDRRRALQLRRGRPA